MARSLALSGADFDARSITNTVLSSTLDSPLSDHSHHTQTSATSTTQRSDASLLRNRQVSSAASRAASETVAKPRQSLKKVLGWPRLAELMAMKPGLESFSRFRELNVKNLLYYQVQLAALEEDLEEAEKKDYGEQQGEEKYAKYAVDMIESGDDDPGTGAGGRQDRQVDIVMKIRRILKEYSKETRVPEATKLSNQPDECLLLYNQVSSLPEPESLNLGTLREWLERPEYGNLLVRGAGSNAWGNLTKEHEDAGSQTNWQRFLFLFYNPIWPRVPRPQETLDLVAVVPRREPDSFTRWIAHQWIPFWHGLKNPKPQARVVAAHTDLEKDADVTTSAKGNNTNSCVSKRYLCFISTTLRRSLPA